MTLTTVSALDHSIETVLDSADGLAENSAVIFLTKNVSWSDAKGGSVVTFVRYVVLEPKE